MGSFDSWTRGIHLSPNSMSDSSGATDSMIINGANEFRGELLVVPGKYEVKEIER